MNSAIDQGIIPNPSYTSSGREIMIMQSSLEKLQARIEALYETRKISDERFSRISEEIGELRSMLIDREREIKELEGMATKASDLVNEVQPQFLNESLQKQDFRIDAIKNKIESNEAVMTKIINELKDVRNKMDLFRGAEETIKLHKDVREELKNIRKIEQNIKMHADKVETIFIRLEGKFEDIEKYKKDAKTLTSDFKNFANQFHSLKENVETFAKKEELETFKSNTSEKIKEHDRLLMEIDDLKKSLSKINYDMNTNLKDLPEKIKDAEIDTEKLVIEEKILDTEVSSESIEFQKLKQLILKINTIIKSNDFDRAKNEYINAHKLYQSLSNNEKKEIYSKLKEIHHILSN